MLVNLLASVSNLASESVLIAAISVFLALVYYVLKIRNLPPGPTGLPFLGIWPFMDSKSSYLQLQAFQKKYGDIFSFKILGFLYVNLGSLKVLREAYITKVDCFAKKYEGFSTLNYVFGEGVFVVGGEKWKVLRKFFVQLFKTYGMSSSKDYMAGPIYDTLDSMLRELRDKNGERINIINLLISKCSITISSILFKDVGMPMEEIQEFNKEYGNLMEPMGNIGLLFSGEFARHLIFPRLKDHGKVVESNDKISNILLNVIKKHEATFDENNIRDMVDSYLKERKTREKKGDPAAKYFTDRALIETLNQFVGDGIHTLAVAIFTFLQVLIEHPEEQEKIYNELIEVIGTDRQPTLDDRGKLPYTNAFFYEVLRTSCIMPFLPSLECTKETTIGGYRVPKGAITVFNFWTIHHDPEIYEEPFKFNPSRFLPSDGKPRPELPVLFGLGKRSCIGEGYAMTQVFLFVITLIRNFRLAFPEGEKNKSVVFFNPENTDICVHPRTSK